MTKTQFYTKFLLIFCSGTLLLSACSKKGCTDPEAINYNSEAKKDDGACQYSEDPDLAENPIAIFDAKVNGQEFSEADIVVSVESGQINVAARADVVSGFPVIAIAFPDNINSGIYSFEGNSGSIRGKYNLGGSINQLYSANAGEGWLVINSHDVSAKVIEGSFEYIAYPNPGNTSTNSFGITQGTFLVGYN